MRSEGIVWSLGNRVVAKSGVGHGGGGAQSALPLDTSRQGGGANFAPPQPEVVDAEQLNVA